MTRKADATEAIRQRAAEFPDVAKGTSCNQSSFKAGTGTFLFIGPGAKGKGYKAMFKLDRSMAQARKLAAEQPERFQVGSTGWVTVRFSDEKPLPKRIWEKWLKDSYEVSCQGKKVRKPSVSDTEAKNTTASRSAVKRSVEKKKNKPRKKT